MSASPVLKPADAARYLGVSPSTLYRIGRTNPRVRPVQLSERRIAYRKSDLDALVAGQADAGGSR